MLRDIVSKWANDKSQRELKHAVETMMSPFRTGNIIVEISDSLNDGRWVKVTIDSLPNHPFKTQLESLIRMHLEDVPTAIGIQAGSYFSDIYVVPENNIQLGEN